MRLYVIDKKTKNKIYLDIDSTTRSELSVRIPKRRFNVEEIGRASCRERV